MNFFSMSVVKLVVVFILLNLSTEKSFSTEKQKNLYEKFYSHFENLTASSGQSVYVKDLTIKRDIGTFLLEDGVLYFCNPFQDRIFSAVFIGKGTFRYIPPTEIEKQQLFRFYEEEYIKENFEEAFFMFADSTFYEITNVLSLTNEPIPQKANKIISESIEYFRDDDYKYIDGDFTKILLDNNYNSYFSSQFSTLDKAGFLTSEDRLFFSINPFKIEDVNFSKGDSRFGHYWKNTINSFSSLENRKIYNHEKFNKKFVDISKYNITTNISEDLDFSATVSMEFSYMYDEQKWIYFNLYNELEVDSIFWSDGSRAEYTREEDSWQLWINVDSTLAKINEKQVLTIYYHGDLLERIEDYWIQLKSITEWFPRTGQQKSFYNLTFKFPKKFRLASIGDKYFSEVNNETVISMWDSKDRLKYASFSIGLYKEYLIENDTIPNIHIYQTKGSKIKYGFDRGMDEQVGIDIENSIIFYQHLFGKTNHENLYICEHPYYHGQAFPGFINLSWVTFAYNNSRGDHELFRAHEVAHQWWGIGVGYKTYHDQWLSEGFSTYSSLMYMAEILKDYGKFFSKF